MHVLKHSIWCFWLIFFGSKQHVRFLKKRQSMLMNIEGIVLTLFWNFALSKCLGTKTTNAPWMEKKTPNWVDQSQNNPFEVEVLVEESNSIYLFRTSLGLVNFIGGALHFLKETPYSFEQSRRNKIAGGMSMTNWQATRRVWFFRRCRPGQANPEPSMELQNSCV